MFRLFSSLLCLTFCFCVFVTLYDVKKGFAFEKRKSYDIWKGGVQAVTKDEK